MDRTTEHLRDLAAAYQQAHESLQARLQASCSPGDFLAEMRRREAMLLERFRSRQARLLAQLEGDLLQDFLDLSKIFDEMRITQNFALQAAMMERQDNPAAGEQAD